MNNPHGWSWTALFFGPFPVLLRGNWRLALAMIAVFIVSLIPVLGLLMTPLFFIAPAVVNRLHDTQTYNPFPMKPDEARNAIVYFVVWFGLIVVAAVMIGLVAAIGVD
jgi:hypothetical protein